MVAPNPIKGSTISNEAIEGTMGGGDFTGNVFITGSALSFSFFNLFIISSSFDCPGPLLLPNARGNANKLSPPVKGAAITEPIPIISLPTVDFTTFLNALPILLKNPILNKLYYDNKYRK